MSRVPVALVTSTSTTKAIAATEKANRTGRSYALASADLVGEAERMVLSTAVSVIEVGKILPKGNPTLAPPLVPRGVNWKMDKRAIRS